MPAIKLKPEYLATFFIAGMLCFLVLLGGGKLSRSLVPCFYILWLGIGVVDDVKNSGKINPYIFRWNFKSILGNRWLALVIIFVLWLFVGFDE